MTVAAPTLGIIAAAGTLPKLVAEAALARGQEVFVIALRGVADADYSAFRHEEIRVGAFDTILKALKKEGCRQVIMTGKFVRPGLASVIPDLRSSRLVMKLLASGDNAALEMIRDEFAKEGMEVIDIKTILSDVMAGEGLIAGAEPDDAALNSIRTGQQVLAALGPFDVGQAVVVQGSRVLAIEAAEGTDAMLDRCAALVDPDLGPAVLVKMRKPDQDGRLDPPVIGATTLMRAADAGISIIAVERGGVLIAEEDEVRTIAAARGMTIAGIAPT
ncbi:LpxI family protein [Alphaproteobacteria bacterium LSUCC0684]